MTPARSLSDGKERADIGSVWRGPCGRGGAAPEYRVPGAGAKNGRLTSRTRTGPGGGARATACRCRHHETFPEIERRPARSCRGCIVVRSRSLVCARKFDGGLLKRTPPWAMSLLGLNLILGNLSLGAFARSDRLQCKERAPVASSRHGKERFGRCQFASGSWSSLCAVASWGPRKRGRLAQHIREGWRSTLEPFDRNLSATVASGMGRPKAALPCATIDRCFQDRLRLSVHRTRDYPRSLVGATCEGRELLKLLAVEPSDRCGFSRRGDLWHGPAELGHWIWVW
jgi:hypothetical protein